MFSSQQNLLLCGAEALETAQQLSSCDTWALIGHSVQMSGPW